MKLPRFARMHENPAYVNNTKKMKLPRLAHTNIKG